MSVTSTRCNADLKFSVPERAWLTSSKVESRHASRAPALSDPSLAAGISVSYISARCCDGRPKAVVARSPEQRFSPPARLGACGRWNEHPTVIDFFVVTKRSHHDC